MRLVESKMTKPGGVSRFPKPERDPSMPGKPEPKGIFDQSKVHSLNKDFSRDYATALKLPMVKAQSEARAAVDNLFKAQPAPVNPLATRVATGAGTGRIVRPLGEVTGSALPES